MVIGQSRRFSACAAILALAVMLTACANPDANNPNLSQAQRELIQSNNRFNQTVGEGVAGGALVGALAGLAFGGVRGALIGAAAGGLTGGVVGYAVARNNYKESQTEGNLQAAIKDAQQDAAAYDKSAMIATRIASDAQAQAALLDTQYQARKISAQQYQVSLASYAQSADMLQKNLDEARKAEADYRRFAGTAPPAQAAVFTQSADRIAAAQGPTEQSLNQIRSVLAASPKT